MQQPRIECPRQPLHLPTALRVEKEIPQEILEFPLESNSRQLNPLSNSRGVAMENGNTFNIVLDCTAGRGFGKRYALKFALACGQKESTANFEEIRVEGITSIATAEITDRQQYILIRKAGEYDCQKQCQGSILCPTA